MVRVGSPNSLPTPLAEAVYSNDGHSCLIKQPPCCLDELDALHLVTNLDFWSGKQRIPPMLRGLPCCHLSSKQPRLTKTSSHMSAC